MAISASMKDMQQSIMNYIKANMPTDNNNAKIGVIRGGKVIIGNRSYDYTVTVDIFFEDGYSVACILPDSGNVAAIVGVL